MPLRGRTRISSTGSGRNGESAMRTPSTTVPLTLRSWLNMLFIRRFLAVFFLVVKHPTQKALFLTPTTVQQRTRTHENSNSAAFLLQIRVVLPQGIEVDIAFAHHGHGDGVSDQQQRLLEQAGHRLLARLGAAAGLAAAGTWTNRSVYCFIGQSSTMPMRATLAPKDLPCRR